MSMTTDRLLAQYRASARPFIAAGVRSLAAGLDKPISLPGKHFLQEDYPADIAEAVLRLARPAR